MSRPTAAPRPTDNTLFARVQRLRLLGYTSLKAADELNMPLVMVNKLWAPTNRDVQVLPYESITKMSDILPA